MNIAVLGAGTIGQSWAALFLANGHQVSIYDPNPKMEKVTKKFVKKSAFVLGELGYLHPGTLEAFRFTSDPSDAVLGCHFIQESAPENLAVKHALYGEIEPCLSPEAIVLSSTSGLTLEMLRGGFNDPSRLVIAHPFNPPHLIPLVEVVGHPTTSTDVMKKVQQFYQSIGKVPIELKKSVPGHIANRLQAVVWQEALHLAKEGVATLDEIDRIVANGPGLRWSIYGPTKLFSLAGGEGGLTSFVDHLGPSFESWWTDSGEVQLDQKTLHLLQEYDGQTTSLDRAALRASRDAFLGQILKLKLMKS